MTGVLNLVGVLVTGTAVATTIGTGIVKPEAIGLHTIAAETSASVAILVTSSMGIPLSATRSINATILGVGVTKRLSAVRWGTTGQIVMTWLITFPVCFVLGYLLTLFA
jgi:PiT family inorganic phosphate transporter